MDVSGVTVPGLPGVVVGHNRNIAWGITNLQADVQDLFVEKIDQQTGQYLFDGRVEQARLEREIIPVKGKPSVELNLWVTRHGPLFVAEGAETMSLRWTAAETGLLQYPILDIDRAEDWTQFTAALARFPGPGSNFVYADRAGNIGYHAAGRIPLRREYRGDLPVDGSSARFDWDGFIPFDKLPSAFNPPSGIVATANQDRLSAQRQFRGALSRAADPRPAGLPWRLARGRSPQRAKGRLLRVRQVPGRRGRRRLSAPPDGEHGPRWRGRAAWKLERADGNRFRRRISRIPGVPARAHGGLATGRARLGGHRPDSEIHHCLHRAPAARAASRLVHRLRHHAADGFLRRLRRSPAH